MSDNNTKIKFPILTIRIGEGIFFWGKTPKKQYKEPDLQSLLIKVEEFLERLS